MNKTPPPNPLNELHLNEEWNSHPAIEWVSKHKNFLLGLLLVLIAFLVFSSRFINWKSVETEKDYIQAQTLFTQFQKSAIDPAERSAADANFMQLDGIMKSHPELKPKYDGALAQTLLINGQIPQATVLIEDIVKRTQPDHLQLYQTYTQASLLVAQNNYAEALTRAKQLQSSLNALNQEIPPTLYVFNLIRLALLYQQMDQPKEELKIWEELLGQTERLTAVLSASEALQVGEASLSQYIEERKKSLPADS